MCSSPECLLALDRQVPESYTPLWSADAVPIRIRTGREKPLGYKGKDLASHEYRRTYNQGRSKHRRVSGHRQKRKGKVERGRSSRQAADARGSAVRRWRQTTL